MTPAEKSVIEAARALVAAERQAKVAYGEVDADLDIDAELEALARAVDALPPMHVPDLRCTGMSGPCAGAVTHIDNKGYLYCTACGERRKSTGTPCRKLRASERTRLEGGGVIRRY